MPESDWSETAAADANANMADAPVESTEECEDLPEVSPDVQPLQRSVSAGAEASDRGGVAPQVDGRDHGVSASTRAVDLSVSSGVSATGTSLAAVVVVIDENAPKEDDPAP